MDKRKRSRSPTPKSSHSGSETRSAVSRTAVLVSVAGLVAGSAAGFLVGRVSVGEPSPREMRAGGYEYINPLIDCGELDTMVGNRFTAALKAEIEGILAARPGCTASVFYRDLLNNPTLSINPEERYLPASLTKIPVMMAYFKHAEVYPAILEKVLPYRFHKEDYEVRYPPGRTMEEGKTYRVEELIHRMIVDSDNAARVMLVNDVFENADGKAPPGTAVPIQEYSKLFSELMLESPNNPRAKMTAKQVASFFRVLYNASYLDRSYSEKALAMMAASSFRQGLNAGIPEGVRVAHKFGEADEDAGAELHDCGIVYHPQRPYLICVMTRSPNAEQLPPLVGEVSRAVFRKVSVMR